MAVEGRMHRVGLRGALQIIFTIVLLSAVLAHAASYVYDANGRLRAVTSSTGASSEYIYDALGNLYAIDSIPASQLAVFAFSPNHGPINSTVILYGQGFSTTPVNNVVEFNGAVASVGSATSTTLTVTVPVGATTGPVSVQVGGNTATSIDNFVVTTDDGGLPPTIASFSPLIASAGTSISVQGAHFVTSAGATFAGVGEYTAAVTPTGDAQLSFTVPTQTGSGPVTVTTPYGMAQSPQPLIVVPTAVGASNVITSAPLTLGAAPQAIAISTAGKYAAATFQGVAGQWVSLQFSQLTTTPGNGALTITVYDQNNTLAASGSVATGNMSMHLPQLKGGVYTVFITPGSATAQFSLAIEVDPSVSVDGASSAMATVSAGQSKRFMFFATAGDNIGLGFSNLVLRNNSSNFVATHVYKPDGGIILYATKDCPPVNCDFTLSDLSQTGNYGVVVTPYDATMTMSFTVTASHDLVTPLTAGVASSVSLRAGQNARFTFSGAPGMTGAVQVTGLTVTPSGQTATLTLLNPDGTTLSTDLYAIGGYTFDLTNLSQTGTYTLWVQPNQAVGATAQVTLIPSSSAAVAIDGASMTVPTTQPGQYAYFDFNANAGDNIGIGISNLALSIANDYVYMHVYKPDGTPLGFSGDCYPPGCSLAFANLPQTGTYAVLVQPYDDPTLKMSFTATVSHDLVTPLTANVASSVNLEVGQNGRFTFSGTAGTAVALQVTGLSLVPAGPNFMETLTVLNPDGTTLATESAYTSSLSGYTFDLPNLPQTGTYTLLAENLNGAAATLQVMLIPSASAAIAIDGASMTVPTTQPGQYVYFDFNANAGDNIGIGISNIALSIANDYVRVYVYKPNGVLLGYTGNCPPPGCSLAFANLPQTGTYAVIVQPYNDPTLKMSFTATVSHDLVTPLTANVASNVSLEVGQNGRFTFSGTAGTSAALQVAGLTLTPAGNFNETLTVLNPDGTTLVTESMYTPNLSGYTFDLPNLPQTGIYTLLAENPNATATTLQVMLIPSASASVAVDGASLTVPTTQPGQYAYFDFNANAGDNIGIGISNIALSIANDYVRVYVYKPNGVLLGYTGNCPPPGCSLAYANLPQTGTYAVIVQPYNDPTLKMSFTATVSHDLVTPLTANVASNVSLEVGQNSRFTFPGTVGAAAALQVAGISLTPTGPNYSETLTVLNPDGTTLATTSPYVSGQSGYTFNFASLPQTGTYTLLAENLNGAATSLQVTLIPSASAAVAINGASQNFATTVGGQYLYFDFTANANQNLTLGISNLVLTNNSYGFVEVYVYSPSGALFAHNSSCSPSGCSVSLPNLPTTGTYGVIVWPYDEPTAGTSFTATLTSP